MKILITGGHITPALAVAEELQSRDIGDIVFVGRKFTYQDDQKTSFEYNEVQAHGFRFVNLNAGRLTRLFNLQSILNLLIIPRGFLEVFLLLRREKPDRILSFGGFIALPVAIIGSLMGIPVFTHEQTIAPGMANKIIAFFAKKVFVSFPQVAHYFDKNKTIISGNPIRLEVFARKNIPDNLDKNKPVLLVLGGSLGSHSINLHIEAILNTLCQQYNVIHQTGRVAQYGDFGRLSKMQNTHYFVKDHISGDIYGSYLRAADVIVSRAGANTIFELVALQKPAVLVPLPWSAGGEQFAQAKLLKKAGSVEIFDQTAESVDLLSKIDMVFRKREEYKKNFTTLHDLQWREASKIIVDTII